MKDGNLSHRFYDDSILSSIKSELPNQLSGRQRENDKPLGVDEFQKPKQLNISSLNQGAQIANYINNKRETAPIAISDL